ncbi:MAG TPA: methyltransferase [Candidatus Brocadiia bacterium]|nr:methyltransferase [Candidatus Brocadiia bacterium]
MPKTWKPEEIEEILRGTLGACVVAAGAELDVFGALKTGPLDAAQISTRLGADLRAVTYTLDALAAMQLLVKENGRYSNAPGIAEALTDAGPDNSLAMVRHLANCMRSWTHLAHVVKSGEPVDRGPSIRGPEGDRESFVEAMNNASRRMAGPLVAAIGPPPFKRLLDVGAGPGTWTIAFLKATTGTTATVYDLPDAMPIARRHVEEAGLLDRVTFAPGNFYEDAKLPAGADMAWVSAIVHMNSREQNRALLRKVRAALVTGGKVLVRDIYVDEARVNPPFGALFAVNMLVNTDGGGTFTFGEMREDLEAAGFRNTTMLHQGKGMDSVVQAIA